MSDQRLAVEELKATLTHRESVRTMACDQI